MVTEELIENIARRFRQGQTREEIKQSLVEEGYEDIDVDEGISHIQKAALEQIPFVAAYTNFMKRLDQKTANLSMPAILGICAVSAVVVLVFAFGLYTFLDPFNARAGERDTQRQEALSQIRPALQRYFNEKGEYPATLQDLSPAYLKMPPKDPKTGVLYEYAVLDNKTNFELCMVFETQPVECIRAAESTVIPIVSPEGAGQELGLASSISGLVFLDSNTNGKQDDPTIEIPVQDAQLIITDSSGGTVCEVMSDPGGTFFCNLTADGVYKVTMTVPEGYRVVSQNPMTVRLPDPADPAKKSIVTVFGIAPLDTPADQVGR